MILIGYTEQNELRNIEQSDGHAVFIVDADLDGRSVLLAAEDQSLRRK